MGLSIMQALQKTTEDIRDWTKDKLSTGLNTKVDKIQGKVLSDNNYSQTDKEKVANMPDNLVVIDNLLYLAQGNNPILDSAVELPEGGGGGGGGGGGSDSVTVKDLMPSTDFSVALGAKEVWVRFEFLSTKSTKGTAYIKTLDGSVLGFEAISYGKNEINIAKYITSSFNPIVIVCTDSYGNSGNSLMYNITAISLSLSISFSDAVAVTTNSFTIPYRLQGDGVKIMHFILDGKDYTETISSSDITTNKTLEFESTTPHGVYSLKIYAEHKETGQKSNEIYEYRIMYAIGSTPLISSVYQNTQAEEYEPINIPFAVYHATNDNPQVDLIISYDGVEYSRTQMYAPRGKLVTWPARVSKQGMADFTISYGGAQVTHSITIVQSSMNATVRTADLAFELKAADKSNNSHKEWVSDVGNVKVDLQNVNWDVEDKTFIIVGEKKEGETVAPTIKKTYAIGTGWRTDEDNNTALRLSGDARAIIEFQPFARDWIDGGATLEMEFAIRDVNNRDAVAISCMHNNIGFKVTADTASLIRNNVPLVKCNYVDDEKIRIAFVVENSIAPAGNEVKLITAYLNGVLSSAVKFTSNDHLLQNPAEFITVGSSDCSIDLYTMRFYNAPLTYNDIKNNYIADARRNDLWADNDIYVNNEINYHRLENKIPILRMTGWPLPSTKNETKSPPKGLGMDRRVDVVYTNKSSTPVIQENQVKIHVQGTSSEGYIRKNWDLDFENAHQHAEGQIPSDYFCMKADYAEATGTHNTGHANYVHTFYTKDKFANEPPFCIDPRARTTIYGFPCVIFHKKQASDPEFTFAGKYNFNFSKDSENVFGFTATDDNGDPLYPYVQSWEFAENKYAPCKFLTDPDEIPDGDGDDNNPGWEKCFEDRYKSKERGMDDFKALYRWVYSTNQKLADGSKLDGDGYVGVDGTVYTHDTKEYRLAKFRKEFEEHFNLNFTLVYYVYTFVMLMVDQRAKNQFLTSWDGQIWHPWLYDNDTSFGINNKGSLIFDYYHEDYDNEALGSHNSTLDQTDVYNGKDSVLWVNFAEAFASEIQQTYGAWRSGSDPLLSYDKIIENFITNHSDQWSISIYNEDAEYKYISMYRNGEPKGDENLYQVRGTGEEHLKYFVKNRLMYCDSKWKTGDFVNKDTNTIIMRINSPEVSDPDLTPSSLIKYKTFSNMYAGVGYGAKSGVSHHKYVERGKEVSFVDNETSGQNDLDTYIFGANEISSLDDLSRLYCGAINVSAASKLTKLTIGNENKNYKNNLLTTLSLSNNRLLRELNICNCTALQGTIDLSLCPDIQKIYAKGSGIAGIQLPASGFLKEITLPATISNLAITKQNRITKFECEGYGNITTLKIDDSTMAIEQADGTIKSTNRFPLQEILLGCNINNLVSVSITNTKWNVDSEARLNEIITKLSQKQGFVLEGSVYLPQGVTVSNDLKILIHQKFPNLNVIDSNPIFYVDYYNYDNTLWDTETVRAGNNAKGPSKGNPQDIIQDEQGLRHLFVEWENLPTNVQQNCRVGAKWQTKYAVTFYNYDNSKIGEPLWYNANEKPEDPIVLGVMSTPTKPSDSADLKYAFNGWEGLPDKVVGPVNVHATFIEQYPVKFYETSEGDYKQVQYGDTQWIIKGQDAIRPVTDPTKASTAEFEYKFLGWVGDYTNVIEPRNIYANYEPIRRSYNVYFYNPGELDAEGKLVVKYKTTVLYGNTVTYRGDKNLVKHGVEAEDVEKYTFVGWSPLVDLPVTGETNYYALFKFTAELKDSWDTIANNAALAKANDGYLPVNNVSADTEGKYYIKQGNRYQEVVLPNDYVDGAEYYMHLSDYYPLGSRKSTTFTIEGKEITAEMEIIACEHDYLNVDGTDRASLTFFCRSLPNIQRQMHSSAWSEASGSGGNIGGYPDSDMRTKFLNTILYHSLEEPLQQAIKPVYKYSDGGYSNKQIVQTQDYCWLASYDEIFTRPYSYKLSGQGDHYSNTFMNKQACQKFLYGSAEADAYARSWWLRSSYCDSGYSYLHVRSDGDGVYMTNATSSTGPYVAFGFCI